MTLMAGKNPGHLFSLSPHLRSESFSRRCEGCIRMRNVVGAGTELFDREKSDCHHRISQRDTRRYAQAAAGADRLAMHEAEISEHGTGKGERRSLGKIALDHEDADGTEDEAGQDRAAAHHF